MIRKDVSRFNTNVPKGNIYFVFFCSLLFGVPKRRHFGSLAPLELRRGKRTAQSFPSTSTRLCVPENLINDTERTRESSSAQLISHVRWFNPRPAELGWNSQVSRLFPLIPWPREFPVYTHTRKLARKGVQRYSVIRFNMERVLGNSL